MKFTVRTQEGELIYGSFGEVEKAWLLGLVGPDDEILEEGKEKWRKASSFPLLMGARRTGEQAWGGSWFLFTCLAIISASIALWLIQAGMYLWGGLVALITVSMMLNVMVRVHKRSKPHG